MALKDDVIKQCEVIRNETRKDANTAERVGSAMLGIVQLAETKSNVKNHSELAGKNDEADVQHLTEAEKFQIAVNKSDIASLQGLWSNYVKIQNPYKDFVGTVMNLEKGISHYGMSLSANSTVSFNTTLLDNGTLWAFDVYFNISNFISVAFPQNVFLYGGNQMLDIGKYHYHFESKDNGLTWTANLVSKKINYIAENGKTIFVKTVADGGNDGNDGLTWATAKATYEGAQSIAIAGDIILMKSGTYIPTQYRTAGVERSRSFIIKNGVNVYGGCQGNESNPDERIMTAIVNTMYLPYGTYQFNTYEFAYPTILSGDLTNSNVLITPTPNYGCRYTTASMANNAYSIVYANLSSKTILNGFIIERGNKTGETGSASLVCSTNYFLIISNCILRDSPIDINKYSLINNTKIEYISGQFGYNSIFNSVLFYKISNCSASINTVNTGKLINSIIEGDMALNNFYNFAIEDSYFSYGVSRSSTYINFLIKNCITKAYLGSSSTSTYINGFVVNNISTGADAFWRTISNDYLANILFSHNSYKNGLLNGNGKTGVIATNITAVRNSGVTHAGIIDLNLINSVVWGNRIGILKENWYDSTGTHTASYCAFEDEVVAGTSNIVISTNNEGDANSPKFKLVSATAGNTTDDFDYDINNGSYLIDKGNNAYPNNGDGSLYDCKGRTRKIDTVDIGCYENQKQ